MRRGADAFWGRGGGTQGKYSGEQLVVGDVHYL